jgi:hypothetical protein
MVTNTKEDTVNVEAHGSMVFTNNIKLDEFLSGLEKYKEVNFNFSDLKLLDHTSLVTIMKWKKMHEEIDGMKITVKGLENHMSFGHSPDSAMRRLD